MTATVSSIISSALSVVSLCLGILNFGLAKRAEQKRSDLEVKNRSLEIDRLLDQAYDSLHGTKGYLATGDKSRLDEAEVAVRRSLSLDDRNSRAIRYQGRLFASMGNLAAAREQYQAAIRIDPSSGAAHCDLGSLLKGEEAIRSLHAAIRCDPRDAWPHYHLGLKLKEMGDVLTAHEHLQKALDLRPKDTLFLVALARQIEAAGDRNEARKLYSKAIALNSTYVDALVGLGKLMIEDGDSVGGLVWIEQAARANPMDSYPYRMVAAIYADKHDPEKALEYCEKAIQVDPRCRLEEDTMQELYLEMNKLIAARKIGITSKTSSAKTSFWAARLRKPKQT